MSDTHLPFYRAVAIACAAPAPGSRQTTHVGRSVEFARLLQPGTGRQHVLVERVLAPAQSVDQVLISGKIKRRAISRTYERRATALAQADDRLAGFLKVTINSARRHILYSVLRAGRRLLGGLRCSTCSPTRTSSRHRSRDWHRDLRGVVAAQEQLSHERNYTV